MTRREIKKGAMAIEAAMLLPIIILLVMTLTFFIEVIYVREVIQNAIDTTGKEMAVLFADIYFDKSEKQEAAAYSEKIIELQAEAVEWAKVRIIEKCRDRLTNVGIVGGVEAIKLYGTEFDSSNVKLVVSYTLATQIEFFEPFSIDITQLSFQRMWTGLKKEPMTYGTQAYICEDSSVYHTNSNCFHIYKEVMPMSLADSINAGIDKCKLCWIYTGEELNNTVYVTINGEKSHCSMSCPTIKRFTRVIDINEVGNRTLCTECVKQRKGE